MPVSSAFFKRILFCFLELKACAPHTVRRPVNRSSIDFLFFFPAEYYINDVYLAHNKR